MAQQLGRAEAQLAKIGVIESALHKLIERVDASPAPKRWRARPRTRPLASSPTKRSSAAGAAERLDAMHRDLVAMNDRARASDDQSVGTIEAVHESLKQLVQQIERKHLRPRAKPRVPFAERMRDLRRCRKLAPRLPPDARRWPARLRSRQASAGTATARRPRPGLPQELQGRRREGHLAQSLAAAIADLENEATPHFGRAKRGQDRGDGVRSRRAGVAPQPSPRRWPTPSMRLPTISSPRHGARLKPLRSRPRSGRAAPACGACPATPSRRSAPRFRRGASGLSSSFARRILLMISALLLYGRLRSKPEPEVDSARGGAERAPRPRRRAKDASTRAAEERCDRPLSEPGRPKRRRAARIASELQPGAPRPSLRRRCAGRGGQSGNFTDVAKSSYRVPRPANSCPAPAASLKPNEEPTLPPGVVFSVGDPAIGAQTARGCAVRQPRLPLAAARPGPFPCARPPPKAMPARNTSSPSATPKVTATPQNLTEAARWLERAASAGLAPAQYRLAVHV